MEKTSWVLAVTLMLLGCSDNSLNAPQPFQKVKLDPQGTPKLSASPADTNLHGDIVSGSQAMSGPQDSQPLDFQEAVPGFVGSKACAECHRDRFNSYVQSDHSRSLRKPNVQEELRDQRLRHPLSGRSYSVSLDVNGDLMHSEHLLDGDENEILVQQKRIDFVIGSGAFAKSYMSQDSNGFVQSPITYYVGSQDYEMSPGYDRAEHNGFSRQIDDQCLFCHAGLMSRKNGNVNEFEIHEMAIGCERCHGPGASHSMTYRQLHGKRLPQNPSENALDSIVNPGKLTRSQVQSLCAQCHLQGNVTLYVQGADAWSFQPGDELQTTKAEYSVGETSSGIGFVGHFSQLEQSKCYQSSEMTCVSCHDPHHVGGKANLDALQRNQCYACHEDQKCTVPKANRVDENDNRCIDCHMPKRSSEVPHVAVTNHRIGIHSSDTKESRTTAMESEKIIEAALPSPIAILDAAPQGSPTRRLHEAMALGRWLLAEATPEQASFANYQIVISRLESTMAEQPVELLDVTMLHANLQFAIVNRFADQLDEKAISSARQRLIADASKCEKSETLSQMDRWSATMVLANVAFELGQFDKSLVRFKRLTQIRRDASDWYNLGLCHAKLRQFKEADESFRRAISLNVTYAAPYLALSRMYATIDPAQSNAFEQQAQLISGSSGTDGIVNGLSQ